jgi:hypothetical protein
MGKLLVNVVKCFSLIKYFQRYPYAHHDCPKLLIVMNFQNGVLRY